MLVFDTTTLMFTIFYCKGQNHSNADFFSQQVVIAYLEQKAILESGYVTPQNSKRKKKHLCLTVRLLLHQQTRVGTPT